MAETPERAAGSGGRAVDAASARGPRDPASRPAPEEREVREVSRRAVLKTGGSVAGLAAAVAWGTPAIETLALRPTDDNARFIGSPGPTGTTVRPGATTTPTETTAPGTPPGGGTDPGGTGGLDALPLTGADPRRLTALGAGLLGAGALLKHLGEQRAEPGSTTPGS